MAAVETSAPPKQGPSLIVTTAVLLALSAAAGGAGWLTGQYLGETSGYAAPKRAEKKPEPGRIDGKHHKADGEHEGDGEHAEEAPLGIVPLAPITTNLAGPGETWVRMEAVLVFDGEADAEMAEFVHQDILAYLRTIKLHQVEGASGFQHLKSDLEERAQIRSEGKVKTILIRTLLFE